MKLHLPKRLLAAVLLCFSAWATSAYATTLEDATMSIASFTQENLDALAGSGWTLTGFDNNIQDGVFTSTSTAATIAPGTSGSSLTTAVPNSRHVWSAIVTVQLDSLTDDVVKLLNGSSIGLAAGSSSVNGTWNGSTTWNGNSLTLPYTYNNGNGTVTFGIVYEGNNGTTLYVGGDSANNFDLKGSNSTVATNITLASAAGIKYTNLYWFNNAVSGTDMLSMLSSFDAHSELTWNGTADNNTWDADSETWKSGSNVVSFGTSGDYHVIFSDATDVSKTVNVSGEQTVNAITLQDSYTFNLQEGASVTSATSIDVAADKTLSLSGNGTVHTHTLILGSNSAVSMAGDANLEVGSALTLDGGAAINMEGNAHLEVGTTLTLNGGAAINMEGNAHLEVGTTLTLNSSSAISMADDASVTAANITLKNGTSNALGNVVMPGNTTLVANGNSTLSVQKFSVSADAPANQTLTLQGSGTLTIAGESELRRVYLQGGSLVVGADTTMGELRADSGAQNSSNLTVNSGVTLTVSNIANAYGIGTMTVNGVLNSTGAFVISTGRQVNAINGSGVINAASLEVSNQTTKAAFSGVTLNLGSGGITPTITSGFTNKPIEFGDMTVGVRDDANGWSTTLNTISLASTGTGTKFAPGEGKSITISGNMSGTGKLVKTGAGTLTLEGANTYAGGTTVEGGTLIVNGTGTLGTGDVTVENGGTLAYNGGEKSLANVTLNRGATLEVRSGMVTLDKAMTVSRTNNGGYSNGNIHLGSTVDSTKVSGTLKLATGGSLTYDNLTITGVDGAEGSISAEGGIELSLYQAGMSASNVSISDATAGRQIGAALTDVAYTNTAGGAKMQGSAKTFSSLSLAGALEVDTNVTLNGENELHGVTINANKNLAIRGTTSAESTTLKNAILTVADGAAYTTGNETITKLTEGTNTTISGTGTVSVATAGITYTNADITVDMGETDVPLETAATLNSSKLTVTGGTVATKVEEGSTNSFDASAGNVTVNTGTATEATVGDLNVGAGQNATFTTETEGAVVTATVTESADVAGTVIANVTVQSGSNDAPATFTAKDHAAVDGSLTITASGQLSIAGEAVADNALTVTGTMTLDANSVLDFTELSITKQTGTQTFVIAKAAEFSINAATRVLGLENLSWTLTNNAGATLLSSGDAAPVTPAMLFSMRSADDTLTLTVLGEGTPDTLTATTVASYNSTNGVLTIGVSESLDGRTGDFNVIVGEDAWDAIVAAMEPNGGIGQEVYVTLTNANGTTLDLNESTGVSLNGYTGETNGKYRVSYIPEPATATLSLLALAALAARRRRK